MALMQAHFSCMDAILQRNRAIRLFGYRQISRVDISDKDHIYRDAFVALRLSSWEPRQLPVATSFPLSLMQVGRCGVIRFKQRKCCHLGIYEKPMLP